MEGGLWGGCVWINCFSKVLAETKLCREVHSCAKEMG